VIDHKSMAVASLEAALPEQPDFLTAPLTLTSPKRVINEFLEWFGDLGIFFWQVNSRKKTPKKKIEKKLK